MPRHNRIYRRNNHVIVVIANVEHTLTEPAFIAFMEQGLNVVQALSAQQTRKQPAGLDLTLTFVCPTCHAVPGSPCLGITGRPLMSTHDRRIALAEQDDARRRVGTT